MKNQLIKTILFWLVMTLLVCVGADDLALRGDNALLTGKLAGMTQNWNDACDQNVRLRNKQSAEVFNETLPALPGLECPNE